MNGKHFRRRPLAIALAATLAFSSANALAADVEIRTPAGGGFAVRDSTGSLLRLFLDGSTGALSIPFLTTAAVQPNPICFQNGTGLVGQCAPGAGGSQGPQGAVGVQGPQGSVGALGPQGLSGAQGGTGAQGPQGTGGAAGIPGTQGPQGVAGIAGAQGVS